MYIEQSFKSQHERQQYFNNDPLTISTNEFGLHDFKYREIYGERTIQGYTAHIILRGCGTFNLVDKSFPISKGDIVISYPGLKLSFKNDQNNPLRYFWCMFNGSGAKVVVDSSAFSANNPVYHLQNSTPVIEKIDELISLDLNKTDFKFRTLSFIFFLFALIKEEREALSLKVKFSKNDYIQQIIQCIESNYSNPTFRVTDISKKLSLSHSYICQLFNKTSVMTVNQYINMHRIKVAQTLLEKTNKKICAIATEVGFADFSYFCRVFKSITHMTPEEYRSYQAIHKRE